MILDIGIGSGAKRHSTLGIVCELSCQNLSEKNEMI